MRGLDFKKRGLGFKGLMLAVIAAAAVPPPARAAEFVLVNTSGATLYELYVSPCGSRNWGPNQLAGAPLWSSRAFSVSDIVPGCYDIMVVLPYWRECIMAAAALQHGLSWTISKSTLTQSIFGDCSQSPHIVLGGRRPWRFDER